MKSFYLLIPVFVFFIACNSENSQEQKKFDNNESADKDKGIVEYKSDHVNPASDAIKLSGTNLDSLIGEIDTSINYEFTDLHAYSDSLPLDDTLIIDDYLEKQGFVFIDWGRGNWMMGPRIITYTYKKWNCECQLSKLYYNSYNDIAVNDSMKVTEWLKCEFRVKDSIDLNKESLVDLILH